MAGIKSKAVPCPALCELYYNFGNSNKCVIRNKSSYLVISPGSDAIRGNFEYQGVGDLNVKGIRLYSPSVNKYNNARAAAEIFITATGGNNAVLTFCIPIDTVSASISSKSVSWFNNWVDTAPNKGGTQGFDINGFSLNHLIPQSGYIIKEGSIPFIGNPKAKNLFFTNSLKAHASHITKIRKIINDAGYSGWTEIPANQSVSYNKLGTTSGPGRLRKGPAQTIKCTPIFDGGGGNLPGDTLDANEKAAAAAGGATMDAVNKGRSYWDSLPIGYKILIIAALPAILLIWAFIKFGYPAIKAFFKSMHKDPPPQQGGSKKSRRRRKKRKR